MLLVNQASQNSRINDVCDPISSLPQTAVLYVGFKSREMFLFLPGEDGKYRVWSGSTDKFGESRLNKEQRVVAVIDPPEGGSYSSMGKC